MWFLPKGFTFPDALSDDFAIFFWNSQNPTKTQLLNSAKNLSQLWPKLAKERGQTEKQHYSGSRNFARIYAEYYLPANLMKAPLILTEAAGLQINTIHPKEKTIWCDIGSGPGTTALGLKWWLSQQSKYSVEIHNIDQSKEFLRLGEELFSKILTTTEDGCHAYWHSPAYLEKISHLKPHIISFSNSIAEIFPNLQKRKNQIQNMIEQMRSWSEQDQRSRWILLIEPAAMDASRELLDLRKSIVEQLEEFKVKYPLLPCIDYRACGAFESLKDWCHEEVACSFPVWHNQLGEMAGLRKQAILFSYLLFPVFLSEEEQINSWPAGAFRSVSQLLEQNGRKECWLCTENGKHRFRISDRKQRERKSAGKNPLSPPWRGDLFSMLESDSKGEIETIEKVDFTLPALLQKAFKE